MWSADQVVGRIEMFKPRSIVALVLGFAIAIAFAECGPADEENSDVRPTNKQTPSKLFGGGRPNLKPEWLELIAGDGNSNESMVVRKAISDPRSYWPNGEVPYIFHHSIKPSMGETIKDAMHVWSEQTCITFRERRVGEDYFLIFRSDDDGCSSFVGRVAIQIGQGQNVSLDNPGCNNVDLIVHELGHAIGFHHEQCRSDRDQHVIILWENIEPKKVDNFDKENDSSYNIPYDLTSVMQYPQWSFSKKKYEKRTIVARDPTHQRFLVGVNKLSFRDRKLANLMYKCSTNCTGTCYNEGYMRPTGGSDKGAISCVCDCPPNFTGAQCEIKLRANYYPDLPCGGIVTKPGMIETPDYPRRKKKSQSCVWEIRAPKGRTISIKINGFEFAQRTNFPDGSAKCVNESVEFRLNSDNMYDGNFYCGNDLSPGRVLESDGHRAVIIILADENKIGNGMSAKIKFLGSKPGEQDQEAEEGQQRTPGVPSMSAVTTTERPSTFIEPPQLNHL